MQTAPTKFAAFLTASLILSACGGGGGGTVATPAPTPVGTTAFTTWRTDLAGKLIQADGQGNQFSGVLNGDYFNSVDSSGTAAAASALFMFDASSNLSVLEFTSTTSTTTRTETFGDSQILPLAVDPDFLIAKSTTSQAVISDPKSLAWDYQSFGVWESGLGTPDRTFHAMSVGAPTLGGNIPLSGTAVEFAGKVVGSYVNSAGLGHTALADLTVIANFEARSLTFSTSTNTLLPVDGSTFTGDPTQLNFTGSANYDPGINSFTGTLTTTGSDSGNGTLTGSTSGQFYGPAAEELGGTFFLNRTGSNETYSGAYGARDITAP